MAVTYTDDEIAMLIAERKLLSSRQLPLILRDKRGHREAIIDVQRDSGGKFRIIIRESQFDPSDFSIILAIQPPHESGFFRLRRYDGIHEHTNPLESTRRNKDKFYDFHIHTATERYQKSAFRDDGYAEATERYNDIDGAFHCLRDDANLYFAQQRFDISANLWRMS